MPKFRRRLSSLFPSASRRIFWQSARQAAAHERSLTFTTEIVTVVGPGRNDFARTPASKFEINIQGRRGTGNAGKLRENRPKIGRAPTLRLFVSSSHRRTSLSQQESTLSYFMPGQESAPFLTSSSIPHSALHEPHSSMSSQQQEEGDIPSDYAPGLYLSPSFLPPLPSTLLDPTGLLLPSASDEASTSSHPIIQFDPKTSPTAYDDEDDDDDADEGVGQGRPKKRKSVANLRSAAAKDARSASAGGGTDVDDAEEKGRRKIMIEYIEEKGKRQ